MPHSRSIQAPISRVVRGSVSLIQAVSSSCCAPLRRHAPGRCEMVARALLEKTSVVCNDIGTDPQMARWREEALRRGYRSVVVLPLLLEDKVTGLLLLYASEAGVFDTKELKLLTELAGH